MPAKPTAKSRRSRTWRSRRDGRAGGLVGQPRDDKIFNPKHAELLRRSFAEILAHGSIAGLVFYQKLFAYEPGLRRMFHTSVELQTRKLMEALEYVVVSIENPKMLVPVLEGLGRRHVTYGVRERHYEPVLRALMETFREVLGQSFSSEVRETWREALDFVASVMKRGAGNIQGRAASIPKGPRKL